MDSREAAEILLSDKKFESFDLHNLEKIGDKYNCVLKEKSYFSSRGFYIYSFKGADSEIDAIEGTILHAMQTGAMPNVTARKLVVEEPEKKRKKKEKVVNEDPPESSL